uniref:Uncharacterized protein n=1 Tax=Arundo donax TaxID=35708 RepID=A0A0A9GY29_ARUDO
MPLRCPLLALYKGTTAPIIFYFYFHRLPRSCALPLLCSSLHLFLHPLHLSLPPPNAASCWRVPTGTERGTSVEAAVAGVEQRRGRSVRRRSGAAGCMR